MAVAGTGAVFFLGSRAHYQVLQQPETRFDVENGNASTETIYQNPSVQLWGKDRVDNHMNGTVHCRDIGDGNEEKSNSLKRSHESPNEATCEEMKPSALNDVESGTPKAKQNRRSLLHLLSSLSRRKKHEPRPLAHLDAILNNCTYRESCRCLDCQSRYFECDEEEEDSSSDDDSEYLHYLSLAMQRRLPPDDDNNDNDDDEVFVDRVPTDATSTDLLLEPTETRVSVTSEESADESMNLEVAAGTPVLLNYLLTHPVTCAIQ